MLSQNLSILLWKSLKSKVFYILLRPNLIQFALKDRGPGYFVWGRSHLQPFLWLRILKRDTRVSILGETYGRFSRGGVITLTIILCLVVEKKEGVTVTRLSPLQLVNTMSNIRALPYTSFLFSFSMARRVLQSWKEQAYIIFKTVFLALKLTFFVRVDVKQ